MIDLEFEDGQQWPTDIYNQRKVSRRPTLTISTPRVTCRRRPNDPSPAGATDRAPDSRERPTLSPAQSTPAPSAPATPKAQTQSKASTTKKAKKSKKSTKSGTASANQAATKSAAKTPQK